MSNSPPATVPLTSVDIDRPIFVVGCPRSGTTLLAALLGRHPSITATPESRYLTYFAPRNRVAEWPSSDACFAVLSNDPKILDLDLDLDLLQKHLALHPFTLEGAFRGLLATYLEQRDGDRILEKTPDHLHHVETLLDWFPDAKFVCVVRDGRDAAVSMRNLPWGYNSIRRYALIWQRSAKQSLKLAERIPHRFKTIRYEDLLTAPESTLKSICQFVDVEFDPVQLDPGRSTDVVPERESAWKKKANQRIDPSRVYAWKRTLDKNEIRVFNSVASEQLAAYGYEAGISGSTPQLKRLSDSAVNVLYRVAFSEAFTTVRQRSRRVLEDIRVVSRPTATITSTSNSTQCPPQPH